MRRLFIPDSESARTIPRLATLLLSVLVVLIATDRAVGYIIPKITIEPPFILRLQNVPGVEKLWDFAQTGVEPIVFTGSSQLYMGISSRVFNEEIKQITNDDVPSVNISIWGGVAAIQHDLIKNLIIPNHPKIILYGVEARALSTEAQYSPEVDDFRNKPLGYAVSIQSDAERALLLWLLQHSNWVRYRDNLRDWLTGARQINQLEFDPTDLDELGHLKNPNIHDRDPSSIWGFMHFAADDVPRQLLESIVSSCKQNGVQCVLLNMPLHELAYQTITETDEAGYRSVLQEIGLPIWDFNTASCRKILGDESFYNLNHLNEHGATIFSKMVADVYAKVFFNLPISGNANCATY
ncbi:MAG: hypothetical protein GC179_22890 [Anaerolineaceae bacterium]|nr:hypothetical protein [Anaerolineaceae bacterium]